MTKFANQTSVSTEKSRMEIESTLRRYGANGFRYGWADRDGKRVEQIDFSASGRLVRFTLPMPSKDDPRFRMTPARKYVRSEPERVKAWEQACRQRWRALALAIKAKLECVECGISEFESEFLSHIVDPETGQTVGETIRPMIERKYAGLGGRIELPGQGRPMNAQQHNDAEFHETTVAKVRRGNDGWEIRRDDGWSFHVPSSSPIEPKVGMTARFYGKGIGCRVRGLLLEGRTVFYRTESEDKEHCEIETYGADAADWLARWDAGRTCWSIEMEGLGPGYEQCIQITAAECLRHLLERNYQPADWEDGEAWHRDRKEIEAAVFDNERIRSLGLSAAQWGAALRLATSFYRSGPRSVLTRENLKGRHILVQRTFPTA